jgi:hypothetical protein
MALHRRAKHRYRAAIITAPLKRKQLEEAHNATLSRAMNLRIAAIRSGTDPVRKLTTGPFQRWLDTPLTCPKCDATYNLAVDWDQSSDRWFPETSRPLITLLKKAIFMGHTTDHRVTHFETEGVIVESVTPPNPDPQQ